MKTALALIIALISLTAQASIVPIGITPTAEGGEDGYAVWVCPEGGTFDWKLTVASLEADITGLPPGRYAMYVTAVFDGVHSDPSNTIQIFIPGAPKGLIARGTPGVALKASSDMEVWSTIDTYYLLGVEHQFFKLEFQP
jgi:hypothetical protein